MEEIVRRFRATGSDGRRYEVVALRNRAGALSHFETEDEEPEADPAKWRYVASLPPVDRGYPLMREGQGRYRMADEGVTLVSDDPTAP